MDRLVRSDPCTVSLVRAREQAGEDGVRVIEDAVAIGARVLEREQVGAQTELVRAEFEKLSREVEHAFGERARLVADQFSRQVDEAFSPEHTHVTRVLKRHFSDASSLAVQHRVRSVVDELTPMAREISCASSRRATGAIRSRTSSRRPSWHCATRAAAPTTGCARWPRRWAD